MDNIINTNDMTETQPTMATKLTSRFQRAIKAFSSTSNQIMRKYKAEKK